LLAISAIQPYSVSRFIILSYLSVILGAWRWASVLLCATFQLSS